MWPLLALTLAFHVSFIISTSRMIEGRRTFVLFDDAAISMRYAENLGNGHGLVWNPGETPVEGITNPLWALWMAVVHLLAPLPRPLATLPVMATSSVLLLVCVVLAARVARQLAPELQAAPPVAAVLTAACYPLAFWSLRGMEVGAVAAAALGALTLALGAGDAPPERRPALHGLGALLLAMVAARLDAAVLVAPLAAWCVWRVDPAHRRRALTVLGGWLVLGVAAMTAARLAYYGEIVPNTYYLKGTGVPMDTRLHFGFWTLGKVAIATLVAPLAAAAGGVAWMVKRGRTAVVALPAALVLLQAGYSVWAGGDAWEAIGYANRYIATVLPLVAVLAGLGVAALVSTRSPERRAAARAVALVGGAGCLAFAAWGKRNPFQTAGVHEWGANRGILWGLGAALVLAAVVASVSARIRPRTTAPPDDAETGTGTGDAGLGPVAAVPPRRGAWALAGGLALLVAVAANVQAVLEWHRFGVAYVAPDAGWARDGVVVAACTDPDTTVGVFAAGQIIYYSGRPGIDLLGKSDPVVAQLEPPPDTPFRPGHNKYSYEWSVGTLRPDLITDTGTGLIPTDLRRLAERWGYEPVDKWMIRRDARGIDREGLRRALGGEQGACTGDGGDGWPKNRYEAAAGAPTGATASNPPPSRG